MSTFSAKSDTLTRHIAFLIFDGAKLLDVTGPLQVFADANEILGWQAYTTTLASLYGGPVTTDTGVLLNTRRLAGVGLDTSDTLIVCGGQGIETACRDLRLVSALQKTAEKAGRLASVCTGAFLLGAAGFLDGRSAVTHWKKCDALARACPKAKVDPDPIFIEDDGVWTSAGVTAGIDLALAMVEAEHSREIALELARSLLVYVKRPGGQSQFSEALKQQTQSASGRFDALHMWMRDNLTANLRVDALAERSGMSPRNFARLYTDETGQTPARAVEHMRVEAARAMLENPAVSIKTIAVRTGFGNDERMRRSFARLLGITPQAYRDRFAVDVAQSLREEITA
ncbi:GlxA family transcriptional regulator [Maricaulis parjimensis]|uniref:GlxA family transcriptional regulator n=1 Tax=Maricaulis parjimensis TaxID=144023 RepID=UPI001939AC74|nr:GlxA family transcriptional regulator [Maricaulis parjimensis]